MGTVCIGRHRGSKSIGWLAESVRLGEPPFAANLTRCLVGDPRKYTTCQMTHSYRAAKVFRLDRRPRTKEQYYKQGRRCATVLQRKRYAFDGPSLDQWRSGDHFMVCFKPD